MNILENELVKKYFGCEAALLKLPSKKEIFAAYGRQSLFGICVEDK